MKLYREPFVGSKEISIEGFPSWYYKPERYMSRFLGREVEIEPSIMELINIYFVEDDNEVYGYRTGITALNDLHGTTQVPNVPEIKSNNVSEKIELRVDMARYMIYPSDVFITKSNSMYLKILDTIENWYGYFDDGEVNTVMGAVEQYGLRKEGFYAQIDRYSKRTKGVVDDVFA